MMLFQEVCIQITLKSLRFKEIENSDNKLGTGGDLYFFLS